MAVLIWESLRSLPWGELKTSERAIVRDCESDVQADEQA